MANQSVALLHGAGYAGGEIIRLMLQHPDLELRAVTSRSFAGQPIWKSHAHLRGQTDLVFCDEKDLDLTSYGALFIAAEHGKSAAIMGELLAGGYDGFIVDLSADFRLKDPSQYASWYRFEHPLPDLLDQFVYGQPEIAGGYPPGTQWVANPGCFATGIGVALWPMSQHLPSSHIAVTALTGASGSGASPKPTTHYPTRDGNVRAYKVLQHQHLPEIQQVIGPDHTIAFTPVSGPWTRGIWGTAQVTLPDGIGSRDVRSWYEAAYGHRPLIRLYPDELPELRPTVGTPFCDVGWAVKGRQLVVGFAIDNLLKGAASQAIQNLNLLYGLPETSGLLPLSSVSQLA